MAFEQAHQAMEQAINTQAPDTQTSAPEASPQVDVTTGQPQTQTPQSVADLAKLQKFMLDGEELTYDQIKKERLRQKDYTRKTQELAEEKRTFQSESKYAVNLPKDLDVLMSQPWRAAEFRKLYPDQYHGYADRIERMYKDAPALWSKSEAPKEQAPQAQQPDIEKMIEDRISNRLKPYEEKDRREQEKTYLAQMDATEAKLIQKYKRANKFEVYAAAEYLAKGDENNPDGRELNDQDWEKLFKDSHDRTVALIKQAQTEDFNEQKLANNKLKDVQSGGGIPGEAPVVAKDIKAATKRFLNAHGG